VKRIKIVVLLAILVVAGMLVWQVGGCVLAYYQFRDDLQDMSAQLYSYVGLADPKSDDQMIAEVVQRAEKCGIELKPQDVTLRRSGTGKNSVLYLAADYECSCDLPGFSFPVHFSASSER
jgi:hypothetical protein